MRRLYRTLKADERGAYMVEFAAIMPVFVMLLMGGFDISYQMYVRSVLEGEVAKAGRDSALETGSAEDIQDAIDAQVTAGVQAVAKSATLDFDRESFSSYNRIDDPAEPLINDVNGNGVCDSGDTYEDSNRNGSRDLVGSSDGFSGAKDAIVYTATATYPRIMPMASLIGWDDEVSVSATTMLRIQPFNAQAAIPEGTCP